MRRRMFFILAPGFLLLILIGFFYLKAKETEIETERENKIYKIFESLYQKKPPKEYYNFYSAQIFDQNFFEETKEQLKKEKLDFLIVNLTENKLYFFKNGEHQRTFTILAQGREGSFWETPTGLYQIETKIEKAYSTIGQVWMPYSLQFQGNFFIHGWPYYPNGKPVETSFSGGCIRLATEDAKEIYQNVKIKTPVLVQKEIFFSDNFSYILKPPEISAQAFLAADLKSNFVFLSKDKEKQLPIASITKLMTALVATEHINLWKKITIQSTDLVFTSQPRLKVGEAWSGFDLLYPLLNESSNEAAKVFGRFLGEKNFVDLMNKKSKIIAMKNTFFADTSGAAKENVSSLDDLFYLAKHLYFNRKFILEISRGKIYSHLLSRVIYDLKNFNCFKEKDYFIGGKVGKTKEAGETILAIFEISFKERKRPIVILILNSKDVCQDTEKIINWLIATFDVS